MPCTEKFHDFRVFFRNKAENGSMTLKFGLFPGTWLGLQLLYCLSQTRGGGKPPPAGGPRPQGSLDIARGGGRRLDSRRSVEDPLATETERCSGRLSRFCSGRSVGREGLSYSGLIPPRGTRVAQGLRKPEQTEGLGVLTQEKGRWFRGQLQGSEATRAVGRGLAHKGMGGC